MAGTQAEIRLERVIDETAHFRAKHESKIGEIEARDDKTLTAADKEILAGYVERITNLEGEAANLSEFIEARTVSDRRSAKLREVLTGSGSSGIQQDGDSVSYETMAHYARDFMLTRNTPVCSALARQFFDDEDVARAHERLKLVKRVANTLSSDVAGLTPAQHINQIFQVIDTSRPIVQSALRSALERGQLTYPRVDTSPVVAVQSAEKQTAGDTGMDVSMQTATASTYLGGGDLSWQAINWSTPNALDLWFRLAAADYALKTEQDAAQVLQHSAFSNNIDSGLLSSTPTFADFMTAVGLAYGEVFDNSARTPNTIYMAPDRYGYMLGLTSSAFSQFTSVSGNNIGPLNIVVSRGMDAGVIVVGDREGLLVAETAGAPVELRVVEPAIGGVEVGIIGAFEAVVVDDGAFAMITTAS